MTEVSSGETLGLRSRGSRGPPERTQGRVPHLGSLDDPVTSPPPSPYQCPGYGSNQEDPGHLGRSGVPVLVSSHPEVPHSPFRGDPTVLEETRRDELP